MVVLGRACLMGVDMAPVLVPILVRVAMATRVVSARGGQFLAGGGHGEFAVLYAAQARQLVGESLNEFAFALNDDDFQAIAVIEVNMQHGFDIAGKGVL